MVAEAPDALVGLGAVPLQDMDLAIAELRQWFQLPWGEWLGALSGTLYLPFEVRHLIRDQSWSSALLLVGNVAVVSYLGWLLWRRRNPPAV